MPEREIICIGCPMGCAIQVDVRDDEIQSIRGQVCARGARYARDEVLAPRRMVTSLIQVPGCREPLSVRTGKPIPKELIFDCLRAIRQARVHLPIRVGDIIIPDVLGTGVPVLATRALDCPAEDCPERHHEA